MPFITTNAIMKFTDEDGLDEVITLESKSTWQQMLNNRIFCNVLYYVGAPLFIGLFIGWGQSPLPELKSHLAASFHFVGFVLIGWLCCITAMAIGKRVLAPWQPPLWALSILPPMVLGWLALIPLNYYLLLANGLWPPGADILKPLPIEPTPSFVQDYMLSMVSVLLLFFGTNYMFQFLGLKQFGYASNSAEAENLATVLNPELGAIESVPFMFLLPQTARGEPLTIQAQEHYINVRTINGSSLIKYSFGNAVKSLEGFPGTQVHRSYWVNDKAVVGVLKAGQRHFLQMDNGEEIPISQSYSRGAREHFADFFACAEVRD